MHVMYVCDPYGFSLCLGVERRERVLPTAGLIYFLTPRHRMCLLFSPSPRNRKTKSTPRRRSPPWRRRPSTRPPVRPPSLRPPRPRPPSSRRPITRPASPRGTTMSTWCAASLLVDCWIVGIYYAEAFVHVHWIMFVLALSLFNLRLNNSAIGALLIDKATCKQRY